MIKSNIVKLVPDFSSGDLKSITISKAVRAGEEIREDIKRGECVPCYEHEVVIDRSTNVVEEVMGGSPRIIGYRDKNGNAWRTVMGGPPQPIDNTRMR